MTNETISLVVHGGAGKWREDKQSDAIEGIREVTKEGVNQLKEGSTALELVEDVVTSLENNETFNAGTGSSLNIDGKVEMDASIMDGSRRLFGAVTALRDVKNPIQVARKVMEETDHAMLTGKGAQRFARSMGFDSHDCKIEESERTYRKKRDDIKSGKKRYSFPNMPDLLEKYPELEKGTVGAVARDREGNYATATSTGGLIMKLVGRVGDTPLPGAGTYATKNSAASATGQGELVMRMLSTKTICDSIEDGLSARKALKNCINNMKDTVGCDAGFIAIDRDGNTAAAHDTPHMPTARYGPTKDEIKVNIAADSELKF